MTKEASLVVLVVLVVVLVVVAGETRITTTTLYTHCRLVLHCVLQQHVKSAFLAL